MTMPIAESERGHRRGVVLGFTMAELLMLLLFCLLLVSATSLLQKDQEIEAIKEELTTATQSPTEVREKARQLDVLLKKLFPDGVGTPKPADFDKLWETIVLARNQSGQLAAAGAEGEGLESLLSVWSEMSASASVEDIKRLVATLGTLSDAGITADEVVSMTREMNASTASEVITEDNRWPPIISLDGNEYRFRTGSAEITPEFATYLQTEAAGKISELLQEYGADVVEIVGHTDEQVIEPKQQTTSNLDRIAIDSVNGRSDEELVPVDNAGLGLARAIEVARVIRQQPLLARMKVVPLSAGQLLQPGDRLSPGGTTANDRDRRRIEIRVRRSTAVAAE